MELFTCSYRAFRPELGAPVVASLLVPKWLGDEARWWPRLWEATPRWAYVKAEPAEFTAAYLAQLERYGPERIARRLAKIASDEFTEPVEKLCLLCWEADQERCHRSTWATWWITRTGEVVDELR